MSSNKIHITPYPASVIEKYLKGQLSAREMHDLEQAALEDPFLADALEGITRFTPDLRQDLDDLRHKLDTKIAAPDPGTTSVGPSAPLWLGRQSDFRRGIRRPLTLAAALLLLLGIGFSFYYLASRPHTAPPAIAQQTPIPATPVPANTVPGAVTPDNITAKAQPPATLSPSDRQRPSDLGASLTSAAATAPTVTTQTPALDTMAEAKQTASTEYRQKLGRQAAAFNQTTANQIASNQPVANQTAAYKSLPPAPLPPTLPAQPFGLQKDSIQYADMDKLNGLSTLGNRYLVNTNASPLTYTGKVLDLFGQPVPGAALFLKGYSNVGTVTDEKGEFRISLEPQDSTQLLTVAMVGYNKASLALNTLSTNGLTGNVIHLEPSTPNLDEVVIVGYGQQRKETLAGIPNYGDEHLDSLWQKATPIIGREAYLTYLTYAKKRLGLDSTITGTETISFEISRDGTLSSFKIEQSLSPAHDAGVIRLINEGPAWRLLKGKKVRASVSVKF